MDKQPLISLITVCYNGQKYLLPYINSLLNQSWSNVQYIFVNDGSTDKTEEIILSYKERFETKGWEFIYIKKPNGGQASAVNAALPRVRGKYFCFVDSDDIIEPNYLEEYCNFLENNKEYKFCYAKIKIVDYKNPDKNVRINERKLAPGQKDNLFEDLLMPRNLPIPPFFMAETRAFDRVVKNRTIYESPIGQNLQVLIPLAYKYKCGYIDKVLCTYLKHESNHSSTVKSINDIKRLKFNIITSIEDMPVAEKLSHILLVSDFFDKRFAFDRWKTLRISLFKIPFMKIKHKPSKIKVYFFGIPILRILR